MDSGTLDGRKKYFSPCFSSSLGGMGRIGSSEEVMTECVDDVKCVFGWRKQGQKVMKDLR